MSHSPGEAGFKPQRPKRLPSMTGEVKAMRPPRVSPDYTGGFAAAEKPKKRGLFGREK
jgi:hypothetical protein